MNIKYPDYNNCITNLACSVLKEFGIKSENSSLQICDELFKKKYKNIVVILLDGMGRNIIDNNLRKDGFFATHLVCNYSSVFPPTTVAATTSIDSGKNPSEHSWLGWDCYYKEIDKNVQVFLNKESETGEEAADYNVAKRFCGYNNIVNKINESGGKAYSVTPYLEPYPCDFDAVCEEIRNLCKLDEKKYIYAYWNEPDHTMHMEGCYSQKAVLVLEELERKVEELCGELEDSLVIVTADHGHIDSKGVYIGDYPIIKKCLKRMPSIEPRAVNFFIKDGYKEEFIREFNKEFSDKFILFSKEEVKEKKLFGKGKEHKEFDNMLGDYLAVAIDDLSIYNSEEEKKKFIGVHAGLTEDEMTIPLIVIDRQSLY